MQQKQAVDSLLKGLIYQIIIIHVTFVTSKQTLKKAIKVIQIDMQSIQISVKMFKFTFRKDIITWYEYGLFLPNENSVHQRDVIANDVDTFENQVDQKIPVCLGTQLKQGAPDLSSR